ncbi:hypothetical protein LEM8419_01004 [Neolewinella maritima]|uniref:Uncharacterized protein n=1 Tax=Neolewinella maritima TaxID=1383882 RepID=A0ABM9AYM0_9BACT|nr:hypothetical protein LEM8419_01004 [Neolewinella maritima]
MSQSGFANTNISGLYSKNKRLFEEYNPKKLIFTGCKRM